jgi:hypothetical protein
MDPAPAAAAVDTAEEKVYNTALYCVQLCSVFCTPFLLVFYSARGTFVKLTGTFLSFSL